MKARYPLRPFLIPSVLGVVTGFALLAALLSDGLLETVSIVLLAGVIGTITLHLSKRTK